VTVPLGGALNAFFAGNSFFAGFFGALDNRNFHGCAKVIVGARRAITSSCNMMIKATGAQAGYTLSAQMDSADASLWTK
jgi:hypothetical protein